MKRTVKCEHKDDISECDSCWTEFTSSETQLTLREQIDKIITAHNVYIDSVWKGTADLYNPPKTAQSILALFNQALTTLDSELEGMRFKKEKGYGLPEYDFRDGYNDGFNQALSEAQKLVRGRMG